MMLTSNQHNKNYTKEGEKNVDDKLDKLVKEVHRLETIFDNCDPTVSLVAILELRAAEERLDLYLREQKSPYRQQAK